MNVFVRESPFTPKANYKKQKVEVLSNDIRGVIIYTNENFCANVRMNIRMNAYFFENLLVSKFIVTKVCIDRFVSYLCNGQFHTL